MRKIILITDTNINKLKVGNKILTDEGDLAIIKDVIKNKLYKTIKITYDLYNKLVIKEYIKTKTLPVKSIININI